MKSIRTQTRIQASRETVWEVLTDFKRYPAWNPFMVSVSGVGSPGSKLTVKVQQPGGGSMAFSPEVLVLKENEELRWKGKFLFGGLFDGEHFFRLEDHGDGTTTLYQGEDFKGLLVSLLKKMLKQTEQGFDQMNQAIKHRSEGTGCEHRRTV